MILNDDVEKLTNAVGTASAFYGRLSSQIGDFGHAI
jgi:hypothetical protein